MWTAGWVWQKGTGGDRHQERDRGKWAGLQGISVTESNLMKYGGEREGPEDRRRKERPESCEEDQPSGVGPTSWLAGLGLCSHASPCSEGPSTWFNALLSLS